MNYYVTFTEYGEEVTKTFSTIKDALDYIDELDTTNWILKNEDGEDYDDLLEYAREKEVNCLLKDSYEYEQWLNSYYSCQEIIYIMQDKRRGIEEIQEEYLMYCKDLVMEKTDFELLTDWI